MARRPTGGTARRALPPAVRGSVHHGLVLAATAVTVLLASTVLAALAALTTSSVDAGAAARLLADPRAEVGVSATYGAAGLPAADRAVRGSLAAVFGKLPEQTYLALYGLDPLVSKDAGPGTAAAQLQLHPAALQGAAAHARLVSGTWPDGAADPPDARFTAAATASAPTTEAAAEVAVDAAIPQALAGRLRAGPGSQLRLADSLGRAVTVRVTGVYAATGAPGFWPGAVGAATDGDTRAGSLLVVSPAALLGQASFRAEVQVSWSALPDLARLRADQLPGLSRRVGDFSASDTGSSVFHGQQPPLDRLVAASSLADAVDELAVPMVVARSALYLPSALLAVLALVALILTARQLTAHRRDELVLRQTRGAGTGRLLAAAAGEWAVVALPAALVAPFLAGPLLHGLHTTGLVVAQPPADALVTAAWAAVALTVLIHAGATLLPVLLAVTGGDAVSRLRLRGTRGAAAQRIGADLALAVVAVLGYLQLAHYRTTVSSSGTDGVADVDPVLVLAPAVATLAAALLLLRLLPPASFLLDRFGRSRRGLVLPLAAWQLGRRSARNAGPVTLMCLAVAVGALATTALAGLNELATDQARFTVGADVRVSQQDALSAPPEALRSALAALPGVTAVTPVSDTSANNADSQLDQIVGIDTRPLGNGTAPPPVPLLRSDLAGPGFQDRLAALGSRTPPDGLVFTGRPSALRLDETLSSSGNPAPPQLALTLEDPAGIDSTVTVQLPPADGARHLVEVPLIVPGGGGTRSYPLKLTGISVLVPPEQQRARLTLTIHRIGAVGPAASAAPTWYSTLPTGLIWADRTLQAAYAVEADCTADDGSGGSFTVQGPAVCALHRGGTDLLSAEIGTAPHDRLTQGGTAALITPVLVGPPLIVPALGDTAAMAEGQQQVGDEVALDLGDGHALMLHIVGTIDAVPGTDLTQGHYLVDQRALAAAEAGIGEPQTAPVSWWLSSSEPEATAAAVARDPSLGTAQTVGQVRAHLLDDPFRAGMRAVLALCRLLAPGFAVIGFTVHAVVTTRERRREFALLRAMGVRRGGLSTLLWAEQLSVALFALVPGALLGTGLAALVLPLVTVDDTGAAPFPSLVLTVPFPRVALTALLTAGAICVVVMSLARLLARVDLVRVLRAGEGT
ncbi:FtsX-like permease family protein [Streptacidiphilus sp. N1-12]|uniref:FtsX-like permease family protein n=2 Tax=Streptacidiphilus alkalitolerans TaxID=3342712 RepID=A0ABV6W7I3_9ACTN